MSIKLNEFFNRVTSEKTMLTTAARGIDFEHRLINQLIEVGFNRMLRFNSLGDYNLPVGNVDFNQNVFNALSNYFKLNKTKQPTWHNSDFKVFLNSIDYQENDLVYLDPPYLITFSEYNKLWNEQTEREKNCSLT